MRTFAIILFLLATNFFSNAQGLETKVYYAGFVSLYGQNDTAIREWIHDSWGRLICDSVLRLDHSPVFSYRTQNYTYSHDSIFGNDLLIVLNSNKLPIQYHDWQIGIHKYATYDDQNRLITVVYNSDTMTGIKYNLGDITFIQRFTQSWDTLDIKLQFDTTKIYQPFAPNYIALKGLNNPPFSNLTSFDVQSFSRHLLLSQTVKSRRSGFISETTYSYSFDKDGNVIEIRKNYIDTYIKGNLNVFQFKLDHH
jgi:hypothetical protein